MEIRAYTASQLTNDYADSVKATQGGAEVSFLDFAAQAVREGKIVMPGETEAGKAGFLKTKFGVDKNPDLEDIKEEEIQKFLTRIQNIMNSNKNNKEVK